MELSHTVDSMLTGGYKGQLRAEVAQASIRIRELRCMLKCMDDPDFTGSKLACPKELLERQIKVMSEYLGILVERISMEGMDIFIVEREE